MNRRPLCLRSLGITGQLADGEGLEIPGILNVSGNARKIMARFSGSIAERAYWQTNELNQRTTISVIPNGTGDGSAFSLFSKEETSTSFVGLLAVSEVAQSVQLMCNVVGGLTTKKLDLGINGATALRINGDRSIASVGSGTIGYGAGSGGIVYQGTNKSTPVTLNKPCGKIVTTGDAIAAGASVYFWLYSTAITADSCVLVQLADGGLRGYYEVETTLVNAGVCSVKITNVTGSSLSSVLTLNFIVLSGASS